MRIKYIDALRGFTMFLVVFWHVMSNGFGLSESIVGSFFRLFRMPMFFFISGYIGYKALGRFDIINTKQLLKRKAFVQLVPTAIIFSFYQFSFGDNPLVFFDKGLCGYWFTLALFELFLIYYCTSYIFAKWSFGSRFQNYFFFFCMTTTWVIGIYLHHLQEQAPKWTIIFSVGNTLRYLPFFIAGLLFRKYYEKAIIIISNIFFFSACVVLFFLGFLLLMRTDLKQYNIFVYYFLTSFLLPYLGVLSVFNIFYRSSEYFNADGFVSRVMQFAGSRTLDIYLLHYFLIADLSKYRDFFLPNEKEFVVGEILVFGFIAIVIMSLCLLFSNCMRKSEVLAKYLFGILQKNK